MKEQLSKKFQDSYRQALRRENIFPTPLYLQEDHLQ